MHVYTCRHDILGYIRLDYKNVHIERHMYNIMLRNKEQVDNLS